jgi:hypothetical protein
MLDDFPSTHGPEREAKILECVRNGRAKYNFVKITSEHNGHKAEFLVFEDALKVDGVRVNVNAITQQQIADLLRCILPTAKLYDIMWDQCKHRICPFPRTITSTTQAMIEHSQDIDESLAEMNFPNGLKSTVGKIWIVDNSLASKPGKACNYGWHYGTQSAYKGIKGNVNASLMKDSNGLYWYMIQGRGWHHDAMHTDYSQVCVLVSRQCWVDGVEMNVVDVLKNPELAPLANHDGVLKVLRQPNVPELEPIVGLPIQPPPLPKPVPPQKPPKPILPTPVPTPVPEPVNPNLPVVAEPSGSIWTLVLSIVQMILELFKRK